MKVFTYLLMIFLMLINPLLAETIGNTYKIAEPDILGVIEQKAENIKFDKEKILKRIKSFRPEDDTRLPRAEKNRVFYPDMSYTLEFDVKDQYGQIIYPKGFRFDPTPYLPLLNPVVIFNPEDPDQLNWFIREYKDQHSPQVIITEGKFSDYSKKLSRPLFYLPKKMAERFQLKAVPSVISQKESRIQVKEVHLE
jgi:conjugal transfer pilus assembly protein TraW